MASRVLKREIVTLVKHADPKIPPMATMEGLDLVTEGVLTIGSALDLLHRYENDEFDEAFFDALDAENGAAKLARLLIEECTDLNLFVGRALNPAHQEFQSAIRSQRAYESGRTAEGLCRADG